MTVVPALHCGQTITVDTTMYADLTCPKNKGLTLAAGVTLDMHGHVLTGPGDGPTLGVGDGVTLPTHGTSAVRNGRIVGWTYGVLLDVSTNFDSASTSLSSMRFDDDYTSIESGAASTSSAKTTVEYAYFFHNAFDLSVDGGGAITLDQGRSVRPGTFAIADDGGTVDVAHTVVDHAQLVLSCGQKSACSATHSAFLTNQQVTRSGSPTVLRLSDDTIEGNVVGVESDQAKDVISGNRFYANTTAMVLQASGATVEKNQFYRNGRAVVLTTGGLDGPYLAPAITDNDFRDNGDGILSTDGIAPSTITGNVLTHSTGYAIDAPHATDGGGNTQAGTGSTPACVGVTCATLSLTAK